MLSKLPKERVATSVSARREHLPPPPFGKTIGHGLIKDNKAFFKHIDDKVKNKDEFLEMS